MVHTYLSLADTAQHRISIGKDGPKLSTNAYFDSAPLPRDRIQIGKENATLVMLVRNFELKGALLSMRLLEDRFNRHYKYPWVFLNEVPFDEEFIEQTTLMASGETFYELIPPEDWFPPEHINMPKFKHNLNELYDEGVVYGGVESYHNMCHFNSGYFYRQKRLLNYEWYFRVEPDVEYLCDFQYDPFEMLRKNNKLYGFVIAIHEYERTVRSLWDAVEGFMEMHPHLLHPHNAINFITTYESDLNKGHVVEDLNSTYNLCHFWSNFEIGNLEFFRGEAYGKYFDYLDRYGGFYYERWGDAPVHTIGISLLMDRDQIHHFEDIGYYHLPFMTCPQSRDVVTSKRCICSVNGPDNVMIETGMETEKFSCLARWWRYGSGKKFLNEFDYTSFA